MTMMWLTPNSRKWMKRKKRKQLLGIVTFLNGEWRSPQLARGGMTTEVDYYELLGVERTADDKTLKTAYRRLALQYHPDNNAGCQDMEATFKATTEDYDCLKEPQKRPATHSYGHEAFKNGKEQKHH